MPKSRVASTCTTQGGRPQAYPVEVHQRRAALLQRIFAQANPGLPVLYMAAANACQMGWGANNRRAILYADLVYQSGTQLADK